MAEKPVKDELNEILGEAQPKKKGDEPLVADKAPRDPPPLCKSRSDRTIKISGYTNNLPPDRYRLDSVSLTIKGA